MYFKLRLKDYPTHHLAFASIPLGVTTLDLSRNNLGHLTGEALADILAQIPKHICAISLKDNYLSDRTAQELIHAFSQLSPRVTTLDLGWNTLAKKSSNELSSILAGIPKHVKSLNLTLNTLNRYDPTELTQIFSSISGSIKQFDLSDNNLGKNNCSALLEALAKLMAGTTVILKNNYLFTSDKTHSEKDTLLTQLHQANPHINLDLSYNGESDIQRAMAPLACFAKKPADKEKDSFIPAEILVHTLSFFLPNNPHNEANTKPLHNDFMKLINNVATRNSTNDDTPIGSPVVKNDTPLNP